MDATELSALLADKITQTEAKIATLTPRHGYKLRDGFMREGIAHTGHLYDLKEVAAQVQTLLEPLPHPTGTSPMSIEDPTLPPSAWPALCGLEAYHSARFGVKGTLGASACPEVRGLLLERKGDCAWLLTLEGVVPVPASGLRFADPAAAWDRVRRLVSGGEPEPEQIIEAT